MRVSTRLEPWPEAAPIGGYFDGCRGSSRHADQPRLDRLRLLTESRTVNREPQARHCSNGCSRSARKVVAKERCRKSPSCDLIKTQPSTRDQPGGGSGTAFALSNASVSSSGQPR